MTMQSRFFFLEAIFHNKYIIVRFKKKIYPIQLEKNGCLRQLYKINFLANNFLWRKMNCWKIALFAWWPVISWHFNSHYRRWFRIWLYIDMFVYCYIRGCTSRQRVACIVHVCAVYTKIVLATERGFLKVQLVIVPLTGKVREYA